MTKRKTPRHRRKTRKTRKIGGAINCEDEGFTPKIREATLGRAYPDFIVDHVIGEQEPYDKLVYISTRGLVRWYCEQAALTDPECERITSMKEVQVLGAFFHRYKVFLEHIETAKTILSSPTLFVEGNRVSDSVMKSLKGPSTPKKVLIKECWDFIDKARWGQPLYGDFQASDLRIQQTIDRVQCLLWVIVKHKKLPDGFVMDKRITERAVQPIELLDTRYQFQSVSATLQSDNTPFITSIIQLGNLIKKVIIDAAELDPVPTVGVYE